jgi:hypothetical protein
VFGTVRNKDGGATLDDRPFATGTLTFTIEEVPRVARAGDGLAECAVLGPNAVACTFEIEARASAELRFGLEIETSTDCGLTGCDVLVELVPDRYPDSDPSDNAADSVHRGEDADGGSNSCGVPGTPEYGWLIGLGLSWRLRRRWHPRLDRQHPSRPGHSGETVSRTPPPRA